MSHRFSASRRIFFPGRRFAENAVSPRGHLETPGTFSNAVRAGVRPVAPRNLHPVQWLALRRKRVFSVWTFSDILHRARSAARGRIVDLTPRQIVKEPSRLRDQGARDSRAPLPLHDALRVCAHGSATRMAEPTLARAKPRKESKPRGFSSSHALRASERKCAIRGLRRARQTSSKDGVTRSLGRVVAEECLGAVWFVVLRQPGFFGHSRLFFVPLFFVLALSGLEPALGASVGRRPRVVSALRTQSAIAAPTTLPFTCHHQQRKRIDQASQEP
jgi:hypothetical protein